MKDMTLYYLLKNLKILVDNNKSKRRNPGAYYRYLRKITYILKD